MAAAKKKAKPTPDFGGAVEPTVRTATEWTPALVKSAELQADAGNLRYAANLCDWLLKNPIISSGLRTRAQQLLGLEPTFERSGDKRRSNRTVKAQEAGGDWWESYPESELLRLVIWGLLLGVCPANQAPWTVHEDHDGRVLPTFNVWHPQHLHFDNQTRTWRIKVASDGFGQTEEELVPGNGEWILHTPFGKNRPWSMGLWRPLADLALLTSYGWWDWGKVSERAILLVLTCLDASAAKELQGYSKEARKQLARDIYARGSEAVAALPPGIDLKAVQAVVDAKGLQGALIEAAHKAIAIVIRGGSLTTDVGKAGSKAATETQADLGDGSNLLFDAQALTTTIHDQSLTTWAELNYGDASLAPWPVYPVEDDEDMTTKTEAEEKAFETVDNAERLGFDVDRAAFLEAHRITWCKPGERPAKIEPTTEPGTQPDPNAQGQGTPPPAPAADQQGTPKPAPPEAHTGNTARRVLASRAAPSENRGFLDGQLYTDALVERSTELGNALVKPTLSAILEELDAAKDYDDLRDRLRQRFASLDPESLSELMYRTMLLGELAGRTAVTQDA